MHKIPARLESKTDLSRGLSIFRVALEEDFVFQPGQYATLWLTHQGKTTPRPYSIASSPSGRRALEFYINLVEDGRMTPSLWEDDVLTGLLDVKDGTSLAVSGPRGHFTLNSEDPRDLVFVASGTGLAPFVSMVRKLNEDQEEGQENGRQRRVYVVHGTSYSSNLGYREELEALAAASLKNPFRRLIVTYLPTISRAHMDPGWTGLKGRAESLFADDESEDSRPLDLEAITKGVFRNMLRPETHAVYLCGHPGTIDNTLRILSARGFQEDKDIKFEKYYK